MSAPQAEQAKQDPIIVEDDYTDEELDVDELERRMWRDKMRLKRLKEMSKSKEGSVDSAKQRQSQEQARRKKMSKMMEVCKGKARGFVCQFKNP